MCGFVVWYNKKNNVDSVKLEQAILLQNHRGPDFSSSIYFDNRTLDMFSDSEEGNLPRKKIRLRSYPPNSNKKNLEIKISSIEGRFKDR